MELDAIMVNTVVDEETGEVRSIDGRFNPNNDEAGADIVYKTMSWQ